ncbi:MAG TPA: hypothetical protein H9870_08600 [Candidatus Corynebacterium avicola]|uniref:DUF559 domain-containing protein n=1 Tax=Candidatus Corynebacterium avicola TaxID=2838527 RepID=A0A9D1RQ49_9CORY|nr:hypothetical protein [Candidatus Corynebacterium avicola]
MARALSEGRYTPGRGPWYSSRILPAQVPERRDWLESSGVSRWVIDRGYDTVTRGVVLKRDGDDGDREATRPGIDTGAYRHCIITRARAQLIKHHETCVLGGWGAAAFHGLKYWADSAPVLLLSDQKAKRDSDDSRLAAKHPQRAAVRELPKHLDIERDTVCPDPEFPHHRVVSAPFALVQCLRSVLSDKHTWYVVDIPGLTRQEVRAIQLIDAFVMCTTVTRNEIIHAARGLVCGRTLKRLLRFAFFGAESPRETELRLFIRNLLPKGHQWRTQVGVELAADESTGKVRRTFFDIACPTLKVGLYYDGAHHARADQAEKDFEQIQDLHDGRWTVIRVDKRLMANPQKMLRQIRNAINRAEIQLADR